MTWQRRDAAVCAETAMPTGRPLLDSWARRAEWTRRLLRTRSLAPDGTRPDRHREPHTELALRGAESAFPVRRRGHHRRDGRGPPRLLVLHADPQGQAPRRTARLRRV